LYGTEIIRNGGFDVDANWSKGTSWTISNGTANYSGVNNANRLRQDFTATIGKVYRVSFDVVTGPIDFVLASNVGGALFVEEVRTIYQVGSYVKYLTASSTFALGIYAYNNNGTGAGSIDNFSIKEITDLTPSKIAYSDKNYDVYDNGTGYHRIFSNAEEYKWRDLLVYDKEMTADKLNKIYKFIKKPSED